MRGLALWAALLVAGVAAAFAGLPYVLPPKLLQQASGFLPDLAHRITLQSIGGARVVLSTSAVDRSDAMAIDRIVPLLGGRLRGPWAFATGL